MKFITPHQVRFLAVARRQVQRLSGGAFDEQQYRMLLRNLGQVRPDASGHVSAKALDQHGFEAVMAFLEGAGFRHAEMDERYWRDRAALRPRFANERQVRLIHELARRTPRYSLAGLCLRFSDGRAESPGKLAPNEAWNLIEMLKSAGDRQQRDETGLDQGRDRSSEGSRAMVASRE